MTASEFKTKHWRTVRSKIVDEFLPLNKALEGSGLSSTEFFEMLDEDANLASEWETAQNWLQQSIIGEMVNAYTFYDDGDQWASKKLKLRVEALRSILDTIESAKGKSNKVPKIIVEYED